MHNMALPLQPIVVSLQPMPLLKRIPLERIPVEHTVALRVEGALIGAAVLAVGSRITLDRVRRPMTSSSDPPPMDAPRTNGSPPRAQTGAATVASQIPLHSAHA